MKLTVDELGRLILSIEGEVAMAKRPNRIHCPECGGRAVFETRADMDRRAVD
jgi:DNA-directed RNA polymerase subunit RPC12/RpoP